MDELYTSGIKLAYTDEFNFIFERDEKSVLSKVLKYRVNCPSFNICVELVKNQKNMSFFI